MNLLQKEKQVDAIIDKICARFKLATTERQWRDFAYCLSLLQFSAKSINKNIYLFKKLKMRLKFYEISFFSIINEFYLGIHRLIESLPLLKDKIHHKQVLKALQSVIEQTKKKPNTKVACIELEEKIEELLKGKDKSNEDDSEVMPPPPVPKLRKRNSRRRKRSSSEEEEDDNIDSDPDSAPVTKSTFLPI